jgi:hypothetical protein
MGHCFLFGNFLSFNNKIKEVKSIQRVFEKKKSFVAKSPDSEDPLWKLSHLDSEVPTCCQNVVGFLEF